MSYINGTKRVLKVEKEPQLYATNWRLPNKQYHDCRKGLRHLNYCGNICAFLSHSGRHIPYPHARHCNELRQWNPVIRPAYSMAEDDIRSAMMLN